MVEIHPHILFLVHIRQMALAGPVGIFFWRLEGMVAIHPLYVCIFVFCVHI